MEPLGDDPVDHGAPGRLRLRIVATSQVHEVPWSEQALEALDSAADQQWSPLPIACEKAAWRESS